MEEEGKEENKEGSNSSAARVYDFPGEPAIVIDGVPEIVSGSSSSAVPSSSNALSIVEPHRSLGLGEWFVGRDVQKLFMGRYYSGKVTEYDKESGWYHVEYEDGDSEDLDWPELKEVLSPLEVGISLKTLAQRVVRNSKKSIPKPGKSGARSQNPQIKTKRTKGN